MKKAKGERKLPLTIVVAAAALLTFLIPTLLLSRYIDDRRGNVYDEYYTSMATDAANRMSDQLNYRIDLYQTQLTGIAFNEELYNQLMREYPDFITQWETVRMMEQAYQYVHGLLPGITQFRIYHHNPTLLENGGVLWKAGERMLDGEPEQAWYQRKLNRSQPEWTVYSQPYNGESYAVLTESIPRGTAGNVGVLYLRMAAAGAFSSALNSAGIEGSSHALADDRGTIFLATDSGVIGKTLEDTAFSTLESSSVGEYRDGHILMQNGDGFHLLNRLQNGWQLYSRIPLSGINQDLNRLNTLQNVGELVVLVLGIAAVLMILHYYRVRLKKLSRRLRSNVPAISGAGVEQSGLADHVDQVEAYYGHMVRQMKDMKLREMEEAVRAMESYVNPHFLYNTLGLIRWRALDDGDEELCSLVDDMTTYYRLSLSGGRSVVTVSDEITHLQAYIAIQQRRWAELVTVDFDLDNAALEAYTPKNILQTVTENCYVHGMAPDCGRLKIQVSVKKEGGSVCFRIEDDGMGIEPEKLKRLNADDETESRGIGLLSVRERLKLYFGENGQLRISSEMGKGTRVLIRIPYCRREPTIMGGEQDVHRDDMR